MQDVYKKIEKYNAGRNCNVLIAFDDMTVDILCNKKLNPIVIELFIRGRKLNIYLVFITQSYFKVLKDVRLNGTHFFIINISNQQEIQQVAFGNSLDIGSEDSL